MTIRNIKTSEIMRRSVLTKNTGQSNTDTNINTDTNTNLDTNTDTSTNTNTNIKVD